MWSSTAPAAIAGFIAQLTDSPDLAGVSVVDGPVVTNTAALEVVTVGFQNEDQPAVVDGTDAREGLGIGRSHELYTINCKAEVLNGASDIVAARGRAYELLDAVGAALAADKTLGDAVMAAEIGPVALSQLQTKNGAVAMILFGVNCDAYTAL